MMASEPGLVLRRIRSGPTEMAILLLGQNGQVARAVQARAARLSALALRQRQPLHSPRNGPT